MVLDQLSISSCVEIDRKSAAEFDARGPTEGGGDGQVSRALQDGGFLYLLQSGELLAAPAGSFDPRFVLLNSARPPPQVRGYALDASDASGRNEDDDDGAASRGYADLIRVLKNPRSVLRVIYTVAATTTLDLNKIKARLEETGAAAATRLAMERALPPQAARFVCFYGQQLTPIDGPQRSLDGGAPVTAGALLADKWIPGTVLAGYSNETYDVALDAMVQSSHSSSNSRSESRSRSRSRSAR